jgi:lysozyme family protein
LPLIPAADTTTGRQTLRRGARGEAVILLQTKLGIKADGGFGPKTEASVRSFQRAGGLVPDGIVGPKTWAALGQYSPDGARRRHNCHGCPPNPAPNLPATGKHPFCTPILGGCR